MNQLAHERLRYSQLAQNYDELQKTNAELQVTVNDLQTMMNALEVQCEETDAQRVRSQMELQEARQEIASLKMDLDRFSVAAGPTSAEAVRKDFSKGTAELHREIKMQKRMLEDQGDALLRKEQEVQSLKRQLQEYQKIRRNSSANQSPILSRSPSPLRHRRDDSMDSESSHSFITAYSATTGSPDKMRHQQWVDMVEEMTYRTEHAVDEKITQLNSLLAADPSARGGASEEEDQLQSARASALKRCQDLAKQLAAIHDGLSQLAAAQATLDSATSPTHPEPAVKPAKLREMQSAMNQIVTQLSQSIDRAMEIDHILDRVVTEKNVSIRTLKDRITDFEQQSVGASIVDLQTQVKVDAFTSPLRQSFIPDPDHDGKAMQVASEALAERNRELKQRCDETEEKLAEANNKIKSLQQDRDVIHSYREALMSFGTKMEEIRHDSNVNKKDSVREEILERLRMQNELLTNEIANISDKCTGLQAEIDRLNREKAKFERDAQTAQESVGIMEAQKSKFETMLKASEGIISSRDQLIQGLEARLAGLENQTADGNRVRELDMKLREKQALAGQLQKELDLTRSDLAMLRQSADQMGRLSQSK